MENYDKEFIVKLMGHENIGAGNFFQALCQHEKNEDRVLLVMDEPVVLPGDSQTLNLTLGNIRNLVAGYGDWYLSQGIVPKDPVALHFSDTAHYFLHYLALTSIGAIPVMINGKLPEDVVLKFIQNVGATILVGTRERYSKFFDIESVVARPNCKFLSFKHFPDDPVLIGHTSGTTGIPKAVQFNHEGFFFGVQQQIHKQVGNRILSALPHSHASAISILMSALLRGTLTKIQTRKDPEHLLLEIEQFKPDFFVSFPKIYVDMCRLDLNQFDLSSISYWLSTGDSNHEPHIKKLIAHGTHFYKGEKSPGSIFIDNLGSSEFGFAAFRNIHNPKSDQFDRCIGTPFDWVDAAVLRVNGDHAPDGEVGYLGVKSKSVTAGYWNNTLYSEKNRLAGYWLTGDLVFRRDDGLFFHVDRTTDPILTKEGVLYTCQTEELILKYFKEIFDCTLVGVDGGLGYQDPILLLESASDTPDESLLSKINELLASRKIPIIRRIIFKATEDIGITGKVLKRVARKRYASTDLEALA